MTLNKKEKDTTVSTRRMDIEKSKGSALKCQLLPNVGFFYESTSYIFEGIYIDTGSIKIIVLGHFSMIQIFHP